MDNREILWSSVTYSIAVYTYSCVKRCSHKIMNKKSVCYCAVQPVQMFAQKACLLATRSFSCMAGASTAQIARPQRLTSRAWALAHS